jgi:hypothetical protein
MLFASGLPRRRQEVAMAIRNVGPVDAYRRTSNATARWQEELIWQRALRRLDKPGRSQTRKKSITSVFSLFRNRLGKHLGRQVDIYV